jgi:hypothetical protein
MVPFHEVSERLIAAMDETLDDATTRPTLRNVTWRYTRLDRQQPSPPARRTEPTPSPLLHNGHPPPRSVGARLAATASAL